MFSTDKTIDRRILRTHLLFTSRSKVTTVPLKNCIEMSDVSFKIRRSKISHNTKLKSNKNLMQSVNTLANFFRIEVFISPFIYDIFSFLIGFEEKG